MSRPLSSPMARAQIGLRDLAKVPRFDHHDLLVRALRFRAEHVVRRNQPLIEPAAEVAQMRIERVERTLHDAFGLSGGDQGPERARRLEPGVEAGRLQVEPGRVPLGAGRTLQRLPNRPAV